MRHKKNMPHKNKTKEPLSNIIKTTISYDDYIKYNGEHGAREVGKLRQEGRDYIVNDGDVMLFRFNVSKSKK